MARGGPPRGENADVSMRKNKAETNAWFMKDDDGFEETTLTTFFIPEKKLKKKKTKKTKNEDEDIQEEEETEATRTTTKTRSLARRAAEKQRKALLLHNTREKKKEEEEEEEKTKTKNTYSSTSSTSEKKQLLLRAYALENAQLRESLRKSLARANSLETELEETTETLSRSERALKDALISHRALQNESKESRKRDRDALNSLRKTLEERERISRGERARCGRALRYAMDCLRAHAPLAKDERNQGGSVLGSVVAELARLTEIAVSAGDAGFKEYVEGSGVEDTHHHARRKDDDSDDDDERALFQRQADAAREAKTKITQLEDERKRLLRALEAATNPSKEYITREENLSFFSAKPTTRDEFLFENDFVAPSRAGAATAFASSSSESFALPGADALARDIDALDSELKKLATAFEGGRM
ncbi:unknown protein [Bathycoccus prasinos]|uniref:Uncharacterized protein n=1 Tax=Bathycoccus prasinos TaxID=41875 RepID=K8EZ20_9CHLO|nr:unknown protein [Bathycoccus prasinos]CCO14468.1 unknown protein [Bathycoccus prasinos]|eukprot:XP_007515589.1 unknown protein [Bathycoccus prasinos]